MVCLNWPQLQRSRALHWQITWLATCNQSCTTALAVKRTWPVLMKFIPSNNYRCGKLERMRAVDSKQAIYQARPNSSHLVCLGKSYCNRGLSKRVIEMLTSPGNTPLKLRTSMHGYCEIAGVLDGRSLCPFSALLKNCTWFPPRAVRCQQTNHTVNTICSAISMTHEHIDGIAVGQHLLVTRFFWGVFNSRPLAPRYLST